MNINAGHNAFGPGRQSNSTIGRAIRFALVNIGGAVPGTGDMAILRMVAATAATPGTNDIAYSGEPLFAFSPEHAETVAAGGYSKAEAKRYLSEHAWVPLGAFPEENIERRIRVKFPERLANAGPDARVPVVQKPEDVLISATSHRRRSRPGDT